MRDFKDRTEGRTSASTPHAREVRARQRRERIRSHVEAKAEQGTEPGRAAAVATKGVPRQTVAYLGVLTLLASLVPAAAMDAQAAPVDDIDGEASSVALTSAELVDADETRVEIAANVLDEGEAAVDDVVLSDVSVVVEVPGGDTGRLLRWEGPLDEADTATLDIVELGPDDPLEGTPLPIPTTVEVADQVTFTNDSGGNYTIVIDGTVANESGFPSNYTAAVSVRDVGIGTVNVTYPPLDVPETSGSLLVSSAGEPLDAREFTQGDTFDITFSVSDVSLGQSEGLFIVFDGDGPGDVGPAGEDVADALIGADGRVALLENIGSENPFAEDASVLVDSLRVREDAAAGNWTLNFYLVDSPSEPFGNVVDSVTADVVVVAAVSGEPEDTDDETDDEADDEAEAAPPALVPAPDDTVEPVDPVVPDGHLVARDRGEAGAVVGGEVADSVTTAPDVPPVDRAALLTEDEVEQRRAETRQFVDDVLSGVPADDRGFMVEDTDDGAVIIGMLADRDDPDVHRPVQPSAVSSASAGDVRLLLNVTSRRGSPRDLASDGALRSAPGGDAAIRGFGLPADTPVQVQIRSEPRVLGELVTDSSGGIAGQVQVPGDIPVGDHTLLVTAGDTTVSVGISVEETFSDVAVDGTHSDAVEQLADAGVVRGRADGTFAPHAGLSRAQMATLLVRFLNVTVDPDADMPFSDVSEDATHASAIATIANEGFTEGCSEAGMFCPDATVSRAQLAAFLARAYNLQVSDNDPFSDVGDVTLAAEIRAAAAAGVVAGYSDGTFRPSDAVTREQAATMLSRAEAAHEG